MFFRKKCDHLPRLSPGPLQDRTLLSHRNFPYSIAVISLNMIRSHRRFSPVYNEFHRRPSTQSSESRWLSMIRKGQHRIRHDGSLEVLKGLLTFSRPMWFRSRVNGLSAARWYIMSEFGRHYEGSTLSGIVKVPRSRREVGGRVYATTF